MLQPFELTLNLPMLTGREIMSDTKHVWQVLTAAEADDLSLVRSLVKACEGLAYAQYMYAPPIHYAVREGHEKLVHYLLDLGAHDPAYRTYHYLDSLEDFALDRGYTAIHEMLKVYAADPSKQRFSGDNGRIFYNHSTEEKDFEKAVSDGEYAVVLSMLAKNPSLVNERSFFWSEGIMSVPSNKNDHEMVKILLDHGATVPGMLKWTHAYYFKHTAMAELLMENGMNPDTHNFHGTTILHDMAQKGDMIKAELLIRYGADIDVVDTQYCSTPLGIAARFGQTEMVRFLLEQEADPQLAGAPWATPLQWAKKRGHAEIEVIISQAINQ